MNKRLETRKYVFTVEGETEQWYLEWLKEQINLYPSRQYNVSIVPKVEKHPLNLAKGSNSITTPQVTHLCDIESKDSYHIEQFKGVLNELKAAKTQKRIRYELGYSNFSFELWIVLHKKDLNGPLVNRSQYLKHINQVFNEKFKNLDHYKSEANFNRCLHKLTLKNVIEAVNRSKIIMENNRTNGNRRIEYKGFCYYEDNPSLSIWESIEQILKDCGIVHNEKSKSS